MKIIYLFVFLTLFILQIQSLTCGGNCPSDTCNKCLCGTQVNYVDLDSFCDIVIQGTTSNKNCCKCIASKVSNGNSNFLKNDGIFNIGVMALNAYSQNLCQLYKQKNYCNWLNNAKCANLLCKAYQWKTWEKQAQFCGCLQNNNISVS